VFIMRYLRVTFPVTLGANVDIFCHISSAIFSKRERGLCQPYYQSGVWQFSQNPEALWQSLPQPSQVVRFSIFVEYSIVFHLFLIYVL
jgi:hypothetical protein